MDVEALKVVALVARQGGFAAAARMLSVDPSSVSRTVAGVEASLGVRLFQRTTRTLTVTEAGDIWLRRIGPLLDEFDHAREAASRISQTPSGTLRMTASVAFAHECVTPHLGAFHRLYPQIAIELIPTDANLDIAATGVDLAVRLAAAPSGDLVATRLCRTRYVVCAAPSYLGECRPVTDPRDLEGHPCLRFALPDFRTRWLFRKGAGAPFEVPVGGWAVIASALSLRRAALDGMGPALLADWLVGRDLTAGRLVELFPDHDCTATGFDTAAWALYPSRAYLPRKVRVMIDFLRTLLPDGGPAEESRKKHTASRPVGR